MFVAGQDHGEELFEIFPRQNEQIPSLGETKIKDFQTRGILASLHPTSTLSAKHCLGEKCRALDLLDLSWMSCSS